jgi:peptidoglycan hydrolase-like protein with peptidoglycan-binding domain
MHFTRRDAPAMRRVEVASAVLLLLGGLLVSCGDDSETITSQAGTTTSMTVPATSPTTAVTTTTTSTTAPPPTTTAPPPTTTTAPPTTTTTPPTTTPSTAAPPATTTPPPTTVSPWLRQGASGDEVLGLQRRLVELGYWLGTPDGDFGSNTHHAVVALQKVAGISRDGVVGPATLDALARGARPATQSTSGLVVEIDLARQVLSAVRDGRVVLVFDASTGSVPGTTPRGHWTVTRQIDGLRQAELGLLYRPKYFHEGVAIHGYTSVPARPASHGCVRVTYPAMDAIWALGLAPVSTPVWVY